MNCSNFFHDKTIVVTGASSGIGKNIALNIARNNARLIMISKDEDKLEEARLEITKITNNKEIKAICCDLSAKKSLEKCIKTISDLDSRVYGLVNNAAINPSREDISGTKESDWADIINTNLTGVFQLTKGMIQLMRKNNIGCIVNISSIAGINGMKNRFSYSVTKSALIGFTNSIAADFSKKNIRVNTICPGYVKTPLTEKFLNNLSETDLLELKEKHPLKGFGDTQDIANIVDFLLSEKSGWITGAIIPVDGGYSIGRD